MTFVMILDGWRPRCATVVGANPRITAAKLRDHYATRTDRIVISNSINASGGTVYTIEARPATEDEAPIACLCDAGDVEAVKACLARIGDGPDEIVSILQGTI